MWRIVVGIIIFVGLTALVAIKLINNAVTEHYSPGFVSASISEARSRGVFISQPNLKSTVIRWEKSEYPIREAWIEQATQIKYDWIFFKQIIPTGYRLILIIDRVGNPPGRDLLYFKDEIVCNGSIRITATQPSTPILMYAEFSSTVPDSIECLVKKPN